MLSSENGDRRPSAMWFKTRKGRDYLVYDNKSHGAPHAMNGEPFWEVRKRFMEKYGVRYEGVDQPPPESPDAIREQARKNFGVAIGVLRGGPDCDREYRRVIELGLRSERWINLFGHHQPLDESGKAGSLDTVLEQVESTVLEQYQRGRKSGGTASERSSEDRDADQPESSRKPEAD